MEAMGKKWNPPPALDELNTMHKKTFFENILPARSKEMMYDLNLNNCGMAAK